MEEAGLGPAGARAQSQRKKKEKHEKQEVRVETSRRDVQVLPETNRDKTRNN